MKISFIGAGKAGLSLASYFEKCGEEICGFYSPHTVSDKFKMFDNADMAADAGELVIISVNDDSIANVWNKLDKSKLYDKTVCHLSGSLTSHIFNGDHAVSRCSMHPMLAFSSSDTGFDNIKSAFFTLEGDNDAVETLGNLLKRCGNEYKIINADSKAAYHAAACFVSNFMTAVCAEGFSILKENCGFSDDEILKAMAPLISVNAENICKKGIKNSLTGPVSRGDADTVRKHLKVLSGRKKHIYKILSSVLAEESGHAEILSLMNNDK